MYSVQQKPGSKGVIWIDEDFYLWKQDTQGVLENTGIDNKKNYRIFKALFSLLEVEQEN